MSTTNRPVTVAALLLAMFMAAMEATAIATAMPTVIADLGGLGLYGWIGAAYLLSSTVTVPLYGKLADRYGRRPVLYAAIVVFLLGSLASGMATTIEQLILFRALQGVGAGGVQPIVVTIMGDLFTPAERGRVQGYVSAVWGFAGVSGPLIGGAIVTLASWRWVFLINLPFGIASMLVLSRAYRENRKSEAKGPLDFAGSISIVSASLLLLIAASEVRPLLTGALAIATIVATYFIERRALDPVLPIPLLERRLIAVATGTLLLHGTAMMGVLNFLPLHVQAVLGGSPTVAGVVVAPMLVGWPLASVVTSRLLVRVGYRKPAWIGAGLTALAVLAIAPLVAMRAPVWILGLMMFLFGCGNGLTNTALVIGVQASVDFGQRGVATATVLFSRSMGSALGVGALGAVMAHMLGDAIDPETVRQVLDPHRRGEALATQGLAEALSGAIDPLFWVAAAAAAVAMFVILFHPRDIEAPAPG